MNTENTIILKDEGVDSIKVSLPFIERVYEIAFGDEALNRQFSEEDVLNMLSEMSDAFAKTQEEG